MKIKKIITIASAISAIGLTTGIIAGIAAYKTNDRSGLNANKTSVSNFANVDNSDLATNESPAVVPTITINEEPKAQKAIATQTTNLPNFTVNATASDSSVVLTYKWYESTTNTAGSGTAIAGATESSYQVVSSYTAAAGTKYFYVEVGGTSGSTNLTPVFSTPVALTVSPIPTITINTQPALNQSATATQTENLPTLSVVASSSDADAKLTYQWYSNTTNTNSGGTIIPDQTNSSFKIPSTDVTTVEKKYYYVVVAGSINGVSLTAVNSTVTTLTIGPAPVINISANPVATNTVVASQATSLPTLSVTASSEAGTSLVYQWYESSTNSTSAGTAIAGASQSTYTINTNNIKNPGTKYYYVKVSGTANNGVVLAPVFSTVSTLTITPLPTITINTQPTDQIVTVTQTENLPSFTVSATSSDTSISLTYQWYENNSNSTTGGTPIEGATNPTYNIRPSDDAVVGKKYFYAKVSGTILGAQLVPAVSNVATLTIGPAETIIITTQPADATLNAGATTDLPTLSVKASVLENTGAATILSSHEAIERNSSSPVFKATFINAKLTYQWYVNSRNSTIGATEIAGANQASYTLTQTDVRNPGQKYYYAIVSGTADNGVTLLPQTSKFAKINARLVPGVTYTENPSSFNFIQATFLQQILNSEFITNGRHLFPSEVKPSMIEQLLEANQTESFLPKPVWFVKILYANDQTGTLYFNIYQRLRIFQLQTGASVPQIMGYQQEPVLIQNPNPLTSTTLPDGTVVNENTWQIPDFNFSTSQFNFQWNSLTEIGKFIQKAGLPSSVTAQQIRENNFFSITSAASNVNTNEILNSAQITLIPEDSNGLLTVNVVIPDFGGTGNPLVQTQNFYGFKYSLASETKEPFQVEFDLFNSAVTEQGQTFNLNQLGSNIPVITSNVWGASFVNQPLTSLSPSNLVNTLNGSELLNALSSRAYFNQQLMGLTYLNKYLEYYKAVQNSQTFANLLNSKNALNSLIAIPNDAKGTVTFVVNFTYANIPTFTQHKNSMAFILSGFQTSDSVDKTTSFSFNSYLPMYVTNSTPAEFIKYLGYLKTQPVVPNPNNPYLQTAESQFLDQTFISNSSLSVLNMQHSISVSAVNEKPNEIQVSVSFLKWPNVNGIYTINKVYTLANSNSNIPAGQLATIQWGDQTVTGANATLSPSQATLADLSGLYQILNNVNGQTTTPTVSYFPNDAQGTLGVMLTFGKFNGVNNFVAWNVFKGFKTDASHSDTTIIQFNQPSNINPTFFTLAPQSITSQDIKKYVLTAEALSSIGILNIDIPDSDIVVKPILTSVDEIKQQIPGLEVELVNLPYFQTDANATPIVLKTVLTGFVLKGDDSSNVVFGKVPNYTIGLSVGIPIALAGITAIGLLVSYFVFKKKRAI